MARAQFARVQIVFDPNEVGAGKPFQSKIIGDVAAEGYVPEVERGIGAVMGAGLPAGLPVMEVQATLIGGASHDVGSPVWRSKSPPGRPAGKRCEGSESILIEPIMKVGFVTLEEYLGYCIGGLQFRRGHVRG